MLVYDALGGGLFSLDGGKRCLRKVYVNFEGMNTICEYCRLGFEAKKESAKYCSGSCRVMACRKREKVKQPTQIETKALYDAAVKLMVTVEKLMEMVASGPNLPHLAPGQGIAPIPEMRPVMVRKTPQDWISEKRDLEDLELYQRWFVALEADPFLTSKQKSEIKKA